VCWVLGFYSHFCLLTFCALAFGASLLLALRALVFDPMACEGSPVLEATETTRAKNPAEVGC
jgi:hypothetical protein